jgi:hypothetical protein
MVATSPDERSPAAQPAATTTATLRAERAAISNRGAEGRSRKTALSENCPDAGSGEEGGEVSTSQPYAARSGSQSATCFSDLELEPEAAIFPSNREIHAYLKGYARRFEILQGSVRLGICVESTGSANWKSDPLLYALRFTVTAKGSAPDRPGINPHRSPTPAWRWLVRI